MVSLQPLDEAAMDFEHQSKKRRREETKQDIVETTASLLDMEPPQETSLPLVWQRCLDIQPEQIITLYNTRAEMKMSKDSRSLEPPSLSDDHMNLDLRLNLPGCSLNEERVDRNSHIGLDLNYKADKYMEDNSGVLKRKPSWVKSEEDDNQEMVAAVCMQCHLLVMLCKSSPACPNCKFVHPQNQNLNCSFFHLK